MKEAMFYEKMGNELTKCNLCSHLCRIPNNKRGICGVRINKKGILYTLVYGKTVCRAADPIEKKPLFHFFPSSQAYSIATVGCNFRCNNCQNFEISQIVREHDRIFGDFSYPEDIVKEAKLNNCMSIAYTYTEPTVFFEFAYDTAKIARKEGIRNVFVTNGYIAEEPLIEIRPYLDAANIDLKGFSEDFYKKNCGARLSPVLESIKLHKSLGIWIEITTLIIPGLNDSEQNLTKIANFIKELDENIPWHISRFHPTYKLLNIPSTPIKTLRRAREIGLEAGLKYVYEGNVPGETGENTYCYKCGRLLIRRYGYQIMEQRIRNSKCSFCNAKIHGVFL